MMRQILLIHINPNTGKLVQLIKKIPYAPEDQEMYFIDISRQEMENLGVKHLSYLNNCYEDGIPFVWQDQPSHIASTELPMPYMRLRLLNAMKAECQLRCQQMEKAAVQDELSARTLLYPATPKPIIIS